MTLTNPALDFGPVFVGGARTLDTELVNAGDAVANVQVAFQEADWCDEASPNGRLFCLEPLERTLAEDGSFAVQPGERVFIRARFSARFADAPAQAAVRWSAADCLGEGCEARLVLTGTGLERTLSCTPQTVDFGAVPLSTCERQTLVCRHEAEIPLLVDGWSIEGPQRAEFEVSPSQSVSLDGGQPLELSVEFCSMGTALSSATLEIELRAADEPVRVPLRGRVSSGAGQIVFFPPALAFGRGAVGVPVRRTVSLTNVGFGPVSIAEIVSDSLGTGAFTVLLAGVDLGSPIQPGAQLDLTVEFTPQRDGQIQSDLVFRFIGNERTQENYPLSGEGVVLPPCQFTLLPGDLDFGVLQPGETLERIVQVRNEGNAACLLSNIRLIPGSTAFNVVTVRSADSLFAPGERQTVVVSAALEGEGTATGALEFSVSNPRQPFPRVPMSVVGVNRSALGITPRVVQYGRLGLGCRSRARTVGFDFVSGRQLTVTDISLETPTGPFRLDRGPSLPLVVPQNGRFEADVTYSNAMAVEDAGALLVDAVVDGVSRRWVVPLAARSVVDPMRIDLFDQLEPRVAVFALGEQPSLSTLAVTVDGDMIPAMSGGIENWRYREADNAIVFAVEPPDNATIEVAYVPVCL